MEKLLVINGCSHSAGSEIPGAGIGDGPECRNNSFGATLAKKLGRTPVHLALPGGSNDWIRRTSTAWIGENLNDILSKKIDVVFLVHWTGAERWEYKFNSSQFLTPQVQLDHDMYYKNFSIGSLTRFETKNEQRIYDTMARMFVEGKDFWSDNKINNIIALQNTLQVYGCKYWFGHAFDKFVETPTYKSMSPLINRMYFPYFESLEQSYYWLGKAQGFDNQDKSGKLWHLGKDAHDFYAEWLYKEFQKLSLA